MDKLLDSFKLLSQMPMIRQLGLLIGFSISIAVGVGIMLWSQTPDYVVLFGNLEDQETAQITQALDRMLEPYRLEPGTGLVTIPTQRVHKVRLKLASEGLPSISSRGFNILYDEQSLGTSSFIEKARYHRALEEELAASIETLESVRAARVHLAIPKQTAFVRNRDRANASILVNLHPGRELNEDQLTGMVYLVASSVPGLEHGDVTLVDQKGRLLSKNSSSKDMLASTEQHRFTREIEAKYVGSIMEILSPILGAEGVRAQVVADLDFVSIERTSENYDPKSLSLRSEQTVSEKGGSPVPIVSATEDETSEPETSVANRTLKATRNYEVDHTISHIKEQPGNIKKISVALVVDYRRQLRADGSVERLQLSEQEILQIQNLVKEAVGFNEQRGDTINVVNAPFLETVIDQEILETPFWKQSWITSFGKQLIGLLGVVFIVFGVLRPLLNRLTSTAPAAAMRPALAVGDGSGAVVSSRGVEVGNEQITLSGQGHGEALQLSGYDQQLLGARALVREDPNKVAQVIKEWVQEDG